MEVIWLNRNLYSNIEFTALKEQLNQEIQRRGTYRWWDPLTVSSVGEDKSLALSLPDEGERFPVDEKTYTINTSSEGSIERTRNIQYPAHGENPSGQLPNNKTTVPNTSAAQFNTDEIRNYLVGLAKIQDVNLFYGRDEIKNLAFRDPQGIVDAVEAARKSELNRPLHLSDLSPIKNDPNGGLTGRKNPDYPVEHEVEYPVESGIHVMPSGEYDGEELLHHGGPSIQNFYDDYGAKPGDAHFHPYNRFTSAIVDRSWVDQGHNRDDLPTKLREGGVPSTRFGANPRNPNQGNQYRSRPAFGGVIGACNVACTGLCYQTCDNQCSESCSTTCWNRCGEACTSTCGNVCTGCSTMCYTSCKTKCENSTGYSCLKAGAKAVKITSSGGNKGEYVKNNVSVTLYTCNGCAYTCQFYPNKKTECWDTGCMGRCFTSCNTYCSTTCFGGCVDNTPNETGSYKTGTGRGCSAGCTINCVGLCHGTCEGYCIQTCWHACKATCTDNCSWECQTNCGNGCFQKCTRGCTGCSSCTGSCEGRANNRGCVGCGTVGGCTSSCQHDCNKNCIGWGCRSICGIDAAGACEANCRLNCMATSCTAMCSDACSSQCTTCVNTCGFQCGPCTSQCSAGCGAECNITCSERCVHSCDLNCVHSCSEVCGGCSNLCYSCIGMCIGVCSVKCEYGCSSCANNCGWWCDSSCNRACFGNCSEYCINTCVGSCSTFLESKTTMTSGPERPPTSAGYIYPNPSNRWEERESFRLFRDPLPPFKPEPPKSDAIVIITTDADKNLEVIGPAELKYVTKQTVISGGVFTIDESTGEITIDVDMIPGIVDVNKPNVDGGGAIFIVILYYNEELNLQNDDIETKLPFGFESLDPIRDKDNNIIVIIQRDLFLLPEEEGVYGEDQ